MSPVAGESPPTGPQWIHEIKHDGFRILALRDAAGVRLFTRNGNDFTARFPLVVAAVATLPMRSCLIDGEAIVSNDSGLAEFERHLIRTRTGEGRKRALAQGVVFGRPRKLTSHQRREALKRVDAGEPLREIALSYAVDRSTISRLKVRNVDHSTISRLKARHAAEV